MGSFTVVKVTDAAAMRRVDIDEIPDSALRYRSMKNLMVPLRRLTDQT